MGRHPGEILQREFMNPLGLNAGRLAAALGVSRSTVGRLLSGNQRLSPAMAARLGAFFRVPARWWLLMQAEFDVAAISEKPEITRDVVPIELGPDVLLTPSGVMRLTRSPQQRPDPVSIPIEDLPGHPAIHPAPRVVREMRLENGSLALVGEPS